MSASPVRPGVSSLPMAVWPTLRRRWRSSPQRRRRHAGLGDLSRRGWRGGAEWGCAALVDSREPANVGVPARGFPPSFRHRRREMGSRRRQPVRCRPQSTWWEGRRPVRDAEVAGSNPAHPTICPVQGPCARGYRSGVCRYFRRTARFDWRVPADRPPGCGDARGSDAVHLMDQMSRHVVGAGRRRRGRRSVAAGITLIS
jgi:hypothetical protein